MSAEFRGCNRLHEIYTMYGKKCNICKNHMAASPVIIGGISPNLSTEIRFIVCLKSENKEG